MPEVQLLHDQLMTAAARQKKYRERHRPKYNLRQKLNMRKYRAQQRLKRIEGAGE